MDAEACVYIYMSCEPDGSGELKTTRIDVYETLCPQQMLVHKGDQIINGQLITGVGSAEMSHLQNCSVNIFKDHCIP